MKKLFFIVFLIFLIWGQVLNCEFYNSQFMRPDPVLAGTVIFEEPREKTSQDKIIYEQIIFSSQWYLAKRSYEVKTYSKVAKKEKKKDLKESERLLSLHIQDLADKYKLYFEDIVDIFNEFDKKYNFGIAGSVKTPLVVIKKKKMFKKS